MSFISCGNVPATTKQAMQKTPIAQDVTLRGTGSWLVDTTVANDRLVLRGRLGFLKGHAGLMVHATDTEQVDDLEMEFSARPGLTVSIMLEGRIGVRIGDREFTLTDSHTSQARAWMLTKPARLTRRSQKGQRIRKVHIIVTRDWLEALFPENDARPGAFEEFTRQNKATISWQPSKRILGLAEQIMNPPRQSEALEKLYVESRAIEIVSDAFSQFSDRTTADGGVLSTKQQERASRITDYIDHHFHDEIPLTKIARDLAMSVASLQRVYKAAYGKTVNEAVRDRRLAAAREAIQKNGLTVGQAAYLAGYADPANFSKAFKRRFGISPSAAKA